MASFGFRTADRIRPADLRQANFTVRDRPISFHLQTGAILFLSIVLGGCFVAFLLDVRGIVLSALLAILLGLGAIQRRQQAREQLSAEFLNAVMASALGDDWLFCLIVRDDGEFVYLNQSFQDRFPAFLRMRRFNLRSWAESLGLSMDKQHIMLRCLELGLPRAIPLIVPAKDGMERMAVILNIDPIAAHAGYFLVRGAAGIDSHAGC